MRVGSGDFIYEFIPSYLPAFVGWPNSVIGFEAKSATLPFRDTVGGYYLHIIKIVSSISKDKDMWKR